MTMTNISWGGDSPLDIYLILTSCCILVFCCLIFSDIHSSHCKLYRVSLILPKKSKCYMFSYMHIWHHTVVWEIKILLCPWNWKLRRRKTFSKSVYCSKREAFPCHRPQVRVSFCHLVHHSIISIPISSGEPAKICSGTKDKVVRFRAATRHHIAFPDGKQLDLTYFKKIVLSHMSWQ